MNIEDMVPGNLYKIVNKGVLVVIECWIVKFLEFNKNKRTEFIADIVAHKFDSDFPPITGQDKLRTFSLREPRKRIFGTHNKFIEPVDIDDLPLYIEWEKSPVYEEILRGI